MTVSMLRKIVRYRLDLARRLRLGASVSPKTAPTLPHYPSVTLFITNMNNRWPLELTLKSALKNTSYPNLKIWIGDNCSTDGSLEMLRGLQKKIDLTIIERDKPMLQHLWYDQVFQTAETDYWIGCHEDILFTGSDWLFDLVQFMESSPATQLLGGEYFPEMLNMTEPHGSQIDLMESLSTWMFCVRTPLREKINVSFEFYKDAISPSTGRLMCFDQGGWLIHEMRAKGLTFSTMPEEFLKKWYHFGNMTWGRQIGTDPGFREFKNWQSAEIQRIAQRYRSSL